MLRIKDVISISIVFIRHDQHNRISQLLNLAILNKNWLSYIIEKLVVV